MSPACLDTAADLIIQPYGDDEKVKHIIMFVHTFVSATNNVRTSDHHFWSSQIPTINRFLLGTNLKFY